MTERGRPPGGGAGWWRRRLARLGVARRLVLLVVVPLAAVAGLTVPVVLGRTASAAAASSVAATAAVDRATGGLLEQLQRERLLSVAYLATPGMDPLPLLVQAQRVEDEVRTVRALGNRPLRDALSRLSDLLATVRARVQARTITGAVAHTVFSQAAAAVLAALPTQTAGSPGSVRAVRSLEELVRANEEAARAGAAVVVAATEPAAGRVLLADATTAQRVHSARFLALARAEHERLLVAAETSQAAQRLADLTGELTREQPGAGGTPGAVGRAAAAVETYIALRRLVGDRIARDIVSDAAAAASRARTVAAAVAVLAALLILVMSVLAATGARSIAVPVRRLSAAARRVASATGQELERVSDTESDWAAPPVLQPVPASGPADVAALASAFNQVQEHAAALLVRQAQSRRNVASMFATVARRTRNLADRQLNLIDTLERHQQNPTLLDHLYRLDHVATRLRRSAAALLVISGSSDEASGPPVRLADVVRAAAAEIEQYARVRLTDAVDVAAVPNLVPDLILMLAELLDNAVSFSPPAAPVTVSVAPTGSGCEITVVDTGIGMSDEQLAAENDRLVERERLDIAPTRVLGLFVVGRLARRNRLEVRLEHTQPSGLTVRVRVPGHLLTAPGPTTARPLALPARPAASRVPDGLANLSAASAAIQAALTAKPFAWFGPATRPDGEPAPGEQSAVAAGEPAESRSGLFRRTPGAQLPRTAPDAPTGPQPDRDPSTEQATAAAFAAGFARAASGLSDLARRRPGAQLDRILRDPVPGNGTVLDPTAGVGERDPQAERRSVEHFLTGFLRGGGAPPGPAAATAEDTEHTEHDELERA